MLYDKIVGETSITFVSFISVQALFRNRRTTKSVISRSRADITLMSQKINFRDQT
jgi:hypothetical protein